MLLSYNLLHHDMSTVRLKSLTARGLFGRQQILKRFDKWARHFGGKNAVPQEHVPQSASTSMPPVAAVVRIALALHKQL